MNREFESSLKDNNRFFTQQRRVLLEELEKADEHLTADQIYTLVKRRMPKVSVGTIYRNLNVLVDLNFVDKVDTSLHSESYYEPHKDPHYHIVCTKCLRIDDLEHYRALSIEPTAEKISGYKISDHQIEFHGLCKKCQENSENIHYEKAEPANNQNFSHNNHDIDKAPSKPAINVNKPQTNSPDSNNHSVNLNPEKPINNDNQKTYTKKKRKFFFGRNKKKY